MTQKDLIKIEQNSYFYEHKFPQPQYLGSKYNLREWIYNDIPNKYIYSINNNKHITYITHIYLFYIISYIIVFIKYHNNHHNHDYNYEYVLIYFPSKKSYFSIDLFSSFNYKYFHLSRF